MTDNTPQKWVYSYIDNTATVSDIATTQVIPHTVSWEAAPYRLPPELTVCQICGEEDVVVFCESCKEILRLAKKVWAKAIMEEIEDAVS